MFKTKRIIAIKKERRPKISQVIRLPKSSKKMPPNIVDNIIPTAANNVNRAETFSLAPGIAPN